MIDPILSLAFSMESNKGVYALLLGSGVSRAAGIPTGYEVTLDLIRKVARLMRKDPEPDPEAWYVATIGQPLEYDSLLASVAHSAAERGQLLRSYFEPTAEDRRLGRKVPTDGHKGWRKNRSTFRAPERRCSSRPAMCDAAGS